MCPSPSFDFLPVCLSVFTSCSPTPYAVLLCLHSSAEFFSPSSYSILLCPFFYTAQCGPPAPTPCVCQLRHLPSMTASLVCALFTISMRINRIGSTLLVQAPRHHLGPGVPSWHHQQRGGQCQGKDTDSDGSVQDIWMLAVPLETVQSQAGLRLKMILTWSWGGVAPSFSMK